MDETPAPQVFISYAWSNEEHKQWVLDLATRLRGDGVDVQLDRWHLQKGDDANHFMERAVSDENIKHVLIIMDRLYKEKADDRVGGAGKETTVIAEAVYSKVKQAKFVPILRERDEVGQAYVPTYLSGRMYFDFSDDDAFEDVFEELLRHIYDAPALPLPPLGKPRNFAPDVSTIGAPAKVALQRLRDAADKDKPTKIIHGKLQEFFAAFLHSLEEIRIESACPKDVHEDDLVVASLENFLPTRNRLIDALFIAATHLDGGELGDEIHEWLEGLGSFNDRKKFYASSYDWWFDNYRFLLYELFLYSVAVLIKTRRYETANFIMTAQYHVEDFTTGDRSFLDTNATHFNNPVQALDSQRKERLKLNRYSVVADMIKERATHPRIAFVDLTQADLLLFLRSTFPDKGALAKGRFGWFPRCAGYLGRGPTQLFAKIGGPKGLNPFKALLQIDSIGHLRGKLEALFSSDRFRGVASSFPFGLNLGAAVNWDAIQ